MVELVTVRCLSDNYAYLIHGGGQTALIDAPEAAPAFDRVLVDAPCTGLGALRRRPESRWRRTPADLAELTGLQSELLDAAAAVLAQEGVAASVTTPDEAVRDTLADAGGGTDVFGWVLGGFAALALLVTALVIGNTFQVLVAQRTRDLALLRTIGATTAQVRASVLTEAAVVGVVGSVLGAGLAVAIVAGVAAAAREMLDLPFLTFGLHPAGLAVSVAVGVAVTVLAALAPAVAATRVAPLEALRPKDEVTAGSRGGRVRAAIGRREGLDGGDQPLRVERLLQHRRGVVPGRFAARAVARGEQERHAERGQPVGHRRHVPPADVDVEHGGADAAVRRCGVDHMQRVGDGMGGAEDLRARPDQLVLDQHRHHGLVLDEQDALVLELDLLADAHGRRSDWSNASARRPRKRTCAVCERI